MTKAPIHCVQQDTGAGRATRLLHLGKMSEKVIHASHDLLVQLLWLDEQLSPKLPCNFDSKGPRI